MDKPSLGYLLARAHEAPTLSTLDRYRAVNVELGAELKSGERIVHRLAWRFDAATATHPQPVQRVDQSVLFSVLFRL